MALSFIGELVFVGEQDGPAERALKAELKVLFDRSKNVRSAYLAIARTESDLHNSVVLCVRLASEAEDEALVDEIGAIFSKGFNREEHLDVCFVDAVKEQEVRE